MKKLPALCLLLALGYIILTISHAKPLKSKVLDGAPPYGDSRESIPNFVQEGTWSDWKRPDGPAKVGLQVGHWKNEDLPNELAQLKGSTGSSGRGLSEWEVNYVIALEVARLLEERGVVVDILPATIPKAYIADVFVAIHADGNLDPNKTGFKIAGPWRDLTGKADKLTRYMESRYAKETGMVKDHNITRNMRGYYAFSWWRFEHAVHPMTTSVIVETGFLSSPRDQLIIVDTPDIPAKGISEGLILFLEDEGLI
jgi:hypothetical protein